ncbi:MAG: HTH-type transcriptional repressor NsrR [Verrucomicrobiae bacterium]|nr:HTH-type transcriptional repressor NsrR [Verrucomicrobiae bacterium]
MLTQTSVTALRLLLHLEREAAGAFASLKLAAESLAESPTYLTKISRHLVRAGILRAQRGPAGGVTLNRVPKEITLLAVVEACQGAIHGDFCQDTPDLTKTCAFHQAGAELHQAIIKVLSSWTLADFVAQACPGRELQGKVHCLLQGGRPGLLPVKGGKR